MIPPTITIGVSNMTEIYFHQVFCKFTNKTSNHLYLSQMIGRVRKPVKNNILIWVDVLLMKKYNKSPQTETKLLL